MRCEVKHLPSDEIGAEIDWRDGFMILDCRHCEITKCGELVF